MHDLGYDRLASETAVLLEFAIDRLAGAVEARQFDEAIKLVAELRQICGELDNTTDEMARIAANKAADFLSGFQDSVSKSLNTERAAEKGRPAYIRTASLVR